MTATTVPTLACTTDRSGARTRSVVRTGAVAGLAAAVATTAVAVGAKALDVPMKAAPHGAAAGQAIPLSGYAMGTILCTAIGTVLAVAFARWAKRPAPVFVVTTAVLTLLSFAGPITTGHATTATRLVLALTHVVAAVIVIPALAGQLPQHVVSTAAGGATGDGLVRSRL